MEKFIDDLITQFMSYYDNLIVLLPKLATALLTFILIWIVANWLKKFSQTRLDHHMDDPLLANFLSRIVKIAMIIFGILVALSILGKGGIASSILAGAGVSAFVIGFALKDIGENFLAGILMAFNRPFRIGDIVETGSVKGTITGLSLRETHIKTFDGKDVYVPNGMIIKNPLVNYTIDGFLRYDFTVGLDYGSNVEQAEAIVLGVLNGIEGILKETKAPSVAITGMSASTLDMTAYFWIDTFNKNINSMRLKTKAIDLSLTELSEAGFYMPGDVLEIKNYQDGDLKMRPLRCER